MSVKVNIPQPKQETSMSRRLFSLAAPIAGFALGGPAGAAAGSILAGKAMGKSGSEAAVGGLGTYASESLTAKKPAAAPADAGDELDLDELDDIPDQSLGSQQLQMPQLGDSAFGRRISAMSQNPVYAVHDGLSALTMFPSDHPVRQAYTPVLVKAQMMGGKGIA